MTGDETPTGCTYRYVDSRGFEELEVYRLIAELSDEIRAEVKRWDGPDLWSTGIQTIRAADSVGANIAEAIGRGTRREQIRFLFIARGSAYELQHWIARAHARGLPCPPNALPRANRTGRMLNGLIRTFSEQRSSRI